MPSNTIHQRRGKKQPKDQTNKKPTTIKTQKPRKTLKDQKLELTILSILSIIAIYILASAYSKYGLRLFIGHAYFDLKLTAQEWRAKIDNDKTILLLGGQHRSGTTLISSLLSLHNDISGLGGSTINSKNTGVDYNEGILMQDVYSRFGVGTEHLINNRKNLYKDPQHEILNGVGKYALNDEALVHLTEHSDLVSLENMKKVLNRFGSHWNLTKKVWMEKSPPNAVISRFLDTLYNLPLEHDKTIASTSSYKITSKSKNNCTKFLFITRHPLANALATDIILGEGVVSFDTILQNYFRIQDYIKQDSIQLRNQPYILKLEDFTINPKKYLKEIFAWLDIDSSDQVLDDIMSQSKAIIKDPNEKYRMKWCEGLKKEEKKRVWAKGIFMKYQGLSDYYGLGYDLEGWCDVKKYA